MASGTITGAGGGTTYSSLDNLSVAMTISNVINAGLALPSTAPGALTAFTYSSGNLAPSPASGSNGVFLLTTPTAAAVLVPSGDMYIDVTANGPVSLQGGAAGGSLLAGAGLPGSARNVTYTTITPTGNLTDTIAITGGNNLVQTSLSGGGNYVVATGSGNDTVNILTGNGTVNAGTGSNQINLGSGNSIITSVGYDTITGSSVGGGSDTVNVTSGQTSINSGTSNFLVNDTSPNPLLVTLGFGVDTVNLLSGAPATIQGLQTNTTASTGAVEGTDTSTGDAVTVYGGASTVAAASANDTITALSGNNLLMAGTGNDTLTAGTGADTLTGAMGTSSTALLVSGTGAGTTFSFTFGKSGGADNITGFKSSDVLSFTGYGTNPEATATTSGHNTTITLSDLTTITVTGVTPLPVSIHRQVTRPSIPL